MIDQRIYERLTEIPHFVNTLATMYDVHPDIILWCPVNNVRVWSITVTVDRVVYLRINLDNHMIIANLDDVNNMEIYKLKSADAKGQN